MLPISVDLQELPDFSVLLPQTLRMPYFLREYSLLKTLDLKKNISTSCDAKNNIQKTSKKVKMATLFSFLKLRRWR